MKIFSIKDVKEVGRGKSDVSPNTQIVVPCSIEGNIHIAGTKCQHGNYIPATSVDPDRSDYCSLCYPYIIQKLEESDGPEQSR